jgi:serine/threonine protein kinase
VGELAERAYHSSCLLLGQVLRRARYSRASLVDDSGEPQVRKHRAFYAPLLIWMSVPLMRTLGTGVRVLPQREWQERERLVYRILHGRTIRVDDRGALVLPRLRGTTLASLLGNPALDAPARRRAIELAVTALADLHRLGFTHGDAMADNVLVDLDGRVAHWIDFENVHDPRRPVAWCRGDDLRALLTSCMIQPGGEPRSDILRLILDLYPDRDVSRLLSASLGSTWRRPLMFHLGQAALSFRQFRDVARLLRERVPA